MLKNAFKIWKEKMDYYDEEESNLTNADIRELGYYLFISCVLTVTVCIVVINLSIGWSNRKAADKFEEVLNTIYAYMATATQDEYDDIAAEIRNDLVLHSYDESQWKYIKLIPNSM